MKDINIFSNSSNIGGDGGGVFYFIRTVQFFPFLHPPQE